MNNKFFAVCMSMVIMVSAFGFSGCKNNTDDKKPGNEPAQAQDEKVYVPTFMYFVSESDENYEEAVKVFEELKAEYDGKVKFDLHNIDENPKDKENFPVDGNTPALIMLNTGNNLSAIEFKCTDKEKLRAYIEESAM